MGSNNSNDMDKTFRRGRPKICMRSIEKERIENNQKGSRPEVDRRQTSILVSGDESELTKRTM